MSEPLRKFVLVVVGHVDDGFTNRLTRHMDGLPGTSLTHVAVAEQPQIPEHPSLLPR